MLGERFSKKGREIPEGPIEAGQMPGMSLEMAIKKYLLKRNNLLKLIRIYSGLSILDVAKKLEISDAELEEIENSDRPVPFQLVPKIAKLFNVDLKMLLVVLGHAKAESLDDRAGEFSQLKLAAQYSGPELTKQEKIDLEELFKTILEHMKAKKG
jgi:transcriptional regulator with XRE-family HTH domain